MEWMGRLSRDSYDSSRRNANMLRRLLPMFIHIVSITFIRLIVSDMAIPRLVCVHVQTQSMSTPYDILVNLLDTVLHNRFGSDPIC
jgi:hypothetical protein